MVDVALLLFPGLGLAMLVLGGALVQKGRFYSRQAERVAETEVTDVASLERGTVAVEGTARVDEEAGTVATSLTGEEALVSHSKVVARPDHADDDAMGRRTLHEEQQAVPFRVEDATGSVRVDPPGEADVRLDENVATEFGAGDPDVADLADDAEAAASGAVSVGSAIQPRHKNDYRRRYEQAALTPGEDVYVLGEAVDGAGRDGSDVELLGGDRPEQFVVSDEGREAVQSGGQIGAYLAYAFGGVLGVLGALMLFGGLVAVL